MALPSVARQALSGRTVGRGPECSGMELYRSGVRFDSPSHPASKASARSCSSFSLSCGIRKLRLTPLLWHSIYLFLVEHDLTEHLRECVVRHHIVYSRVEIPHPTTFDTASPITMLMALMRLTALLNTRQMQTYNATEKETNAGLRPAVSIYFAVLN